ncbi:MAG: squalene synthase HpnC [Opitutales bacterium]
MPAITLDEARRRCHALTREHYENFPVARLVPEHARPHVSAIYAFARTADDIADEGWSEPGSPTPEDRVATLRAYEAELDRALADEPPKHPEWAWIFVAVADTVRTCQIPPQLLRDLLDAFRQDCLKLTYSTYAEVLDYARRSANPIGRLVLLVHGQADEQRFAWSDAICTALQLANFWQDVGVDIRKDGRIYVPQEDWPRHGLRREHFDAAQAGPELRSCLQQQVARTRDLFAAGAPLPGVLPMPLKAEIKLTWLGGQRILDKIEAQNYDTLAKRPKLTKWDGFKMLTKALLPG